MNTKKENAEAGSSGEGRILIATGDLKSTFSIPIPETKVNQVNKYSRLSHAACMSILPGQIGGIFNEC